MSRTYRRNKPHLIRSWVGHPGDKEQDAWWLMYRYPTLTLDQAYERSRARYTRDHPSGRFGVPRYFRRQLGSKQLRLKESAKIHRGLRSSEWDDHLPEPRVRNAGWYWF